MIFWEVSSTTMRTIFLCLPFSTSTWRSDESFRACIPFLVLEAASPWSLSLRLRGRVRYWSFLLLQIRLLMVLLSCNYRLLLCPPVILNAQLRSTLLHHQCFPSFALLVLAVPLPHSLTDHPLSHCTNLHHFRLQGSSRTLSPCLPQSLGSWGVTKCNHHHCNLPILPCIPALLG